MKDNTITTTTVPLSIMERAERFISGFEGDTMQEGVDQLLRDIRQLIEAAKSAPAVSLMDLVQEGVDAAELVVGNWESGDLAGAVHGLEQWAERSACRLESFIGLDQPVAVVEIAGGNVSGTTVLGAARLLVLDYDNGETDETCPEIPMRDGARASIDNCTGRELSDDDTQFVRQLLAVADVDQG